MIDGSEKRIQNSPVGAKRSNYFAKESRVEVLFYWFNWDLHGFEIHRIIPIFQVIFLSTIYVKIWQAEVYVYI